MIISIILLLFILITLWYLTYSIECTNYLLKDISCNSEKIKSELYAIEELMKEGK